MQVIRSMMASIGLLLVTFVAVVEAWQQHKSQLSMHSSSSPKLHGVAVDATGAAEDSTRRRELLFSFLAAAAATPAVPGTAQALELNAPNQNINSLTEEVFPGSWPSDDRDYVVYMLKNGLRVVLASDPTSNEAGAAMDVHVGATSDPWKVPGK